ncbi:unnamed protein product, partial [Symbiodinium microadriaticum]
TPLVSSGSRDRAPICFQQLRELIEKRLRPSLRSQALKPGDRVAALVPNGPEAASLFLSVLMCGLCYGPLDPSMTRIEVEFALRDLPASVLVLSDGLASVSVALAEMAAKSLGIKVMTLRASTHTAGLFTLHGASGPASGLSVPTTAGYGSEMPELVTRSRDEVGLALHTSGSTRRPKLVPLTHANLCSGSICIASTLQLGPSDVVMNCLPLFHIHGLVVNVLVPAIAGSVAVCLPSFDATAAAKQLREGISVYSAVPSAHHAILESLPTGASYESLRIIRNCSAHLPASLASELERKMATEVLPWRLDELCPGVTSGYECRHGIDPNLEVKRKPATLISTAPETGTGEGWLKTGDLATLTSKGLVLTGRCKEIINKAGEKLSPLQLLGYLALWCLVSLRNYDFCCLSWPLSDSDYALHLLGYLLLGNTLRGLPSCDRCCETLETFRFNS